MGVALLNVNLLGFKFDYHLFFFSYYEGLNLLLIIIQIM